MLIASGPLRHLCLVTDRLRALCYLLGQAKDMEDMGHGSSDGGLRLHPRCVLCTCSCQSFGCASTDSSSAMILPCTSLAAACSWSALLADLLLTMMGICSRQRCNPQQKARNGAYLHARMQAPSKSSQCTTTHHWFSTTASQLIVKVPVPLPVMALMCKARPNSCQSSSSHMGEAEVHCFACKHTG